MGAKASSLPASPAEVDRVSREVVERFAGLYSKMFGIALVARLERDREAQRAAGAWRGRCVCCARCGRACGCA